jgi:hypothetical protein
MQQAQYVAYNIGMNIEKVDAVIAFAGGLYPETNLPNHLSISRLFQIEDFLAHHKESFGSVPTIVFCGGQYNYHTGVTYSEPSSDIYMKYFDNDRHIIKGSLLSTQRGFCTVTEALGAKHLIKEHNWKTVALNTSLEHEARVLLIGKKVFGSDADIIKNPYNQPDGSFMNTGREGKLSELFTKSFSQYENGTVPYTTDEQFYKDHIQYYESQRSLIESTAKTTFDSMAYLRK